MKLSEEKDSSCNPKVSVLMLTYNQARYVDAAIESVLAQRTDFDVELVIGDDCSTDETVAKLRRWKERYPDKVVLLESEKNGGLLCNFVRTFNACRGGYVAICEGDDYWISRKKLQRQVAFLDAHPDYSTSIHRVVNYYEDEGTMSLSNGGQKESSDIYDLARMNFITNVSAVFRNTLRGNLPEWISEVGTYDYAVHMLNSAQGKIHYMSQPMAVYRKRGGAIWSQSGRDKQLRLAMQVRRCLMTYFRDIQPEVWRLLADAYANNGAALVAYYRSVGRGGDADAALVEVLSVAEMQNIDDRVAKYAVAMSEVKRERLVSKLRKALTRLLPVPKWCRIIYV